MPYSAFPDRAIPYHIDGSIIKFMNATAGVTKTLSSEEMAELNDFDYTMISLTGGPTYCVVFFPELRDISAIFATVMGYYIQAYLRQINSLQWSADTTNGLDGTWNNATVAEYPPAVNDLDSWRKSIKAVTGISGAIAIRFSINLGTGQNWAGIYCLHLYGTKHSGETEDDILFLDAEDGDAEFAIPLDFGDRPAGTSEIHQIKVKNVSPDMAASTVTLTVHDDNDLIRVADSSSGPWNTSKVIASLAANTASAVIYVKCETPAPPTPLGPQKPYIDVTVGSWS